MPVTEDELFEDEDDQLESVFDIVPSWIKSMGQGESVAVMIHNDSSSAVCVGNFCKACHVFSTAFSFRISVQVDGANFWGVEVVGGTEQDSKLIITILLFCLPSRYGSSG